MANGIKIFISVAVATALGMDDDGHITMTAARWEEVAYQTITSQNPAVIAKIEEIKRKI